MTGLPPVLLLDLDDTILDDTGSRDACWATACAEIAPLAGLDPAHLRATVERVREAFWSDPDRSREWRSRMREAWGRIGSDALAELGIDDPALGGRLGDRHFELRDAALAPLPGAFEALARFRAAGSRLGLVTNGGSDGQRAKIARFALAGHFEYVGIEGEVGAGKPHPEAYERALAAFEVDADAAWMVGDNLEWDVAGAQAVGISGIWLDRAGRGLPDRATVRPDRIVRAIGELFPA